MGEWEWGWRNLFLGVGSVHGVPLVAGVYSALEDQVQRLFMGPERSSVV